MYKNQWGFKVFAGVIMFVGVGLLVPATWFVLKTNSPIDQQKSTNTAFQQSQENIKNVIAIPSDWQWFTSNDGSIKFAYPKTWGDLKQQFKNEPPGSYESKFMHPPVVTKKKDLLIQIGKGFTDYVWYFWDETTNSLVSAIDTKPPSHNSLETYQRPVDLGSIEKIEPFAVDTVTGKAIYEIVGKGAINCGTYHYFFDVSDNIVHLTANLCTRDGEWQPESGQAYSDVVHEPIKDLYKYIEE